MVESRMRTEWEETWYHDNCQELDLPCPVTNNPKSYVHPTFVLVKYIFCILPSWAPLVWVVNGKSLRGYGLSNSSLNTSNESFKTNSLDKSSLADSSDSRTDQVHLRA